MRRRAIIMRYRGGEIDSVTSENEPLDEWASDHLENPKDEVLAEVPLSLGNTHPLQGTFLHILNSDNAFDPKTRPVERALEVHDSAVAEAVYKATLKLHGLEEVPDEEDAD